VVRRTQLGGLAPPRRVPDWGARLHTHARTQRAGEEALHVLFGVGVRRPVGVQPPREVARLPQLLELCEAAVTGDGLARVGQQEVPHRLLGCDWRWHQRCAVVTASTTSRGRSSRSGGPAGAPRGAAG
jgi:hypothetical protein